MGSGNFYKWFSDIVYNTELYTKQTISWSLLAFIFINILIIVCLFSQIINWTVTCGSDFDKIIHWLTWGGHYSVTGYYRQGDILPSDCPREGGGSVFNLFSLLLPNTVYLSPLVFPSHDARQCGQNPAGKVWNPHRQRTPRTDGQRERARETYTIYWCYRLV